MHVAYIHQHFSTRKGATGTRSYELSQCLLEAGHRVSMICGLYEASRGVLEASERVSRSDVDGIDVYCIAEKYSNSMGFARRVLSFLRFMKDAQRVAVGIDADVVFATSTPLTVGIPGMKAARKRGVPFVFEVRDLWPDVPIAIGVLRNPLLIWYTRRLERRIYKAAERIVALSPGMKDGIVRTGYPADRVHMIPNSCDLDLFRPSDEPLTDKRFGSPDEFRLVFTGAHGLANGLDAVVDAAVELKRRGVTGVRFVFIGQGKLRDHLMQRSRDEGVDDITTWAPFISKEELAQVLPRFDVGMMILKNLPDFYYGTSPNKFFDYIASGLPVLNNYPGWVADMIGEYGCGIAVAPDDPGAFVDAVLKLRDDPAARAEMGRNARRLAEERFDRKRLGAEFVKVLERAAKR
ncbi:MAG: glycosyltransferase WbuB, partial [Planctomycetota bacterium]